MDQINVLSMTVQPLKVIIVGDYGIGKTRFLNTYYKIPQETPIIKEVHQWSETRLINYVVNDEPMQLKIWDTNGQEKFQSITISYYKDAVGVLLCFSLKNKQSFNNLGFWIKQLKNHANEEIVIQLIGLNGEEEQTSDISQEDIQNMTKKLNCHYFSITSLESDFIDPIFQDMAEKVYKVNKESVLCCTDDLQIYNKSRARIRDKQSGKGNKIDQSFSCCG